MTTQRPRIFTWHVHGNYLLYLTQADADFYLPYNDDRTPGYVGKSKSFPFGDNVHEVPIHDVADLELDLILFQDDVHYLEDRKTLFSTKQQTLPRIYLEHDPPLADPVKEKHIVDDPDVLLVHVTYFNRLMWDNNRTPTTVIEHGVLIPEDVRYTGTLDKGIVMANNIQSMRRGQRRMGYDILEYVRQQVPLDIIGMGSQEIGGLGEFAYTEVAPLLSRYRFFFNPIRYTSLPLSVCEAMTVGLPMFGVATTEMVRTVENGVSGYVDTDIDTLITKMQHVLTDKKEADRLHRGAAKRAGERFAISRFVRDWETVFREMLTNM